MDDVKGGRGVCKYYGEMWSNISYHETNHCRKNPALAEQWIAHDEELRLKLLGAKHVEELRR